MEQDEKYNIFHTWNIKKANPIETNDGYEIDEARVEITDDEVSGSEFEGDGEDEDYNVNG